MRTRLILALLMVISMTLSIAPTVSADTSSQGETGTGNTFNPGEMTQADKDHLVAKDKLAANFMKALAGKVNPDSSTFQLNVGASGAYQEPNDHAYDDYCGPAATRVAIRARTTNVPLLLTVASQENTVPYPPKAGCTQNCGTDLGYVHSYINTYLNTTYYVIGAANGFSQFASWWTWDIEAAWSPITLIETQHMPGWGGHVSSHYVSTYGIVVNGSTLQTVYYVDTASADAGHTDGKYFESGAASDFWTWITQDAGYGQVW